MIGSFFLYFAIYIYTVLTTAFFFNGLMRSDDKNITRRIVIVSIVLSQVLLSWFLEKVVYFVPGLNDYVYISIVLSLFLVIALPFYKTFKCVSVEIVSSIRENYVYTVFPVLILLTSVVIAINLPVSSNDPSEYINVAQNIYKYKDFNLYPLVDASIMDGYFPWSHPSAFVGIIDWSFMIQGRADTFILFKLFNPIVLFATFLLFFHLFSENKLFGLFSGLLAIAICPLYIVEVFNFHIDPMRIFTFFVPFIFMRVVLNKGTLLAYALLSLFLGLALHSHSLGILAIPLYLGVYFLFSVRNKSFNIVHISIILLGAALIVGFRYYINYNILGYIVGDNTPLWKLESLDYKAYLEYSRGLYTASNKVFNGILKGFSHISSFGFMYWIFALSIIYSLFYTKPKLIPSSISLLKIQYISLLVVSFWYVGSTGLTILGSDILIKNDRYLLTINFFIIYVILYIFNKLLIEKTNEN